jgi:hypothetical protein
MDEKGTFANRGPDDAQAWTWPMISSQFALDIVRTQYPLFRTEVLLAHGWSLCDACVDWTTIVVVVYSLIDSVWFGSSGACVLRMGSGAVVD